MRTSMQIPRSARPGLRIEQAEAPVNTVLCCYPVTESETAASTLTPSWLLSHPSESQGITRPFGSRDGDRRAPESR